jgi:uncharacterized lipoprotein YehR (DUF1307 family)
MIKNVTKMEKQQPEKYRNIKGTENVRYKDKTSGQGRTQYKL